VFDSKGTSKRDKGGMGGGGKSPGRVFEAGEEGGSFVVAVGRGKRKKCVRLRRRRSKRKDLLRKE